MTDAREEAVGRMVNQAESLGAHAVVNVRFTTSQITDGGAEILVYGTAVKLKNPPSDGSYRSSSQSYQQPSQQPTPPPSG